MKRFIGPVILFLSCALVALMSYLNQTPVTDSSDDSEPPLPLLAHQQFQVQNLPDRLQLQGRVRARWNTQLASEVVGRVVYVAPALTEGAHYRQGELLVGIDDSRYQQNLARAQADLATAERVLLEQQEQARGAERSWQQSGFKGKATALVSRTVHVEEAQLQLKAAKQDLARAQAELRATEIRAPFDGVVIERSISLGDFVQTGSQLLQLQDSQRLDVEVLLSPEQIWRLGSEPVQQVAEIQRKPFFDAADAQPMLKSQAQIITVSATQNSTNQWRKVILSIDNPQGFIAGELVDIRLSGRMRQVILVPPHFLSTDGAIWLLDQQRTLIRQKARALFVTEQGIALSVNTKKALTLVVNASGHLEGAQVALQQSDKALVQLSAEVQP